MPRDWKQGLAFLLGFAFVMWLGPLVVNIAQGETADGDLRALEVELFEHVNRVRGDYHRAPLKRRGDLDAIARKHSEDMAARGFFAHENPEGQNPLDRVQASKIKGYSLAAENIGKTNVNPPSREIINGWMFSKPHRKNLLAPPFNQTGIGVARAPDGNLIFTQVYLTIPR